MTFIGTDKRHQMTSLWMTLTKKTLANDFLDTVCIYTEED